MRWLWSAEGYGLLVAATAMVASWRTGWVLRTCAWSLFASWAASRLLAGRLDLAALAVAHAFIHIALLILFVLLLTRAQALWLALAGALALLQAAGNVVVVGLADPIDTGPRSAYDLWVAGVFGLQLGCIWLALTPVGRWWPRRRPG